MSDLYELLRPIGVWTTLGLLAAGYLGGFVVGSLLLRAVLRFVKSKKHVEWWINFRDVGTWIGLCEHFLVVSFVLAGEYTAIALVFAAKELVRADKVKDDPGYYLLGTLLNITLSILFGVGLKLSLLACAGA